MKKIICTILVVIMALGMAVPAFAATADEKVKTATPLADELKALGLFAGTGNGYELERAATRAEGLTMLLRLMGESDAASKFTGTHPFTDVPTWVDRNVAYAYSKGYTSGTSATTYGSSSKITAVQYLTFVLRALGYTDGYKWNESYLFAETIGLIPAGSYRDANEEFIRADMVIISYNALSVKIKGTNMTLKEKLFGTGIVNQEGAAGVFEVPTASRLTVDKSLELWENRERLNDVLFWTYTMRFYDNGIGRNVDSPSNDVATLARHEDGRFGVKIFAWRNSYDSDVTLNTKLNMVLEAMYYFSGDAKVAYALWSHVDNLAINGKSNSDSFGFKDAYKTASGNWVIEMNGVYIEMDNSVKGVRTYWFDTK